MDRKILQRLHEKLPKTGSTDFLEGASFMLAALEDILDDNTQEAPITLPDSVFCIDALLRHMRSGDTLPPHFMEVYRGNVHRNIQEIYPTVAHTDVHITVDAGNPMYGPHSHEATILTTLTHMDGYKSDYIYKLRVPTYEYNISARRHPWPDVLGQNLHESQCLESTI